MSISGGRVGGVAGAVARGGRIPIWSTKPFSQRRGKADRDSVSQPSIVWRFNYTPHAADAPVRPALIPTGWILDVTGGRVELKLLAPFYWEIGRVLHLALKS